jgi:hypothetical protein
MLQHVFLSLLMYMFMLAVVWLSQWYRFQHGPAHGKGGGRSLLPRRLKPRTPLDCPACCLSGLKRTLCGAWIKLCVGRASEVDQSEGARTSV